MIYLTGDTHGNFKRIINFCNERKTTKDDLMIILGDAGLNYFLNEKDEWCKNEIQKLPIRFLCVHGNHEERPFLISSYKGKEFASGIVYYEPKYPDILFAKDGEVYNLDGKSCLVLGGAYSVDKYYRLAMGYHYFASEIPAQEMKEEIINNINKLNWKVDIVLSHTVPQKYEPTEWFISNIDQSTVDKSVEIFLDEIENKLDYTAWYAGHYHGEKSIDKLRIMFENYIDLDKDFNRLQNHNKDKDIDIDI